MKYLKFGFNVLITIFDVFILWVLVMCILATVQPRIDVASATNDPTSMAFVALIFLRLFYVLLAHMGFFEFYEKLGDAIASLIKTRFAK